MLETDKFPAEYLPNFANQVNNWLGDMIRSGHIRSVRKRAAKPNKAAGPAPQPTNSYHLGENFLMLFLNDPERHAVSSLDRDVSELVTPTGRRHYQIKDDGTAIAYARSVIDRNESICQLFSTRLANDVQNAIEKLDAYESEHPEFAAETWRVRLITIPTFHTHAFLIQRIQSGDEVVTSGSYVYVISAPPWLDKLPREMMLNSRQFLLGFKGEMPIIGVAQKGRQQIKEQIDMAKKKPAKAESQVSNSEEIGGPGGHSDVGGGNHVPTMGRHPLFASLVFPFTEDLGIGGGGGHIGTLGGPPEGVDPIFVVFTYPVPPQKKQDITNS